MVKGERPEPNSSAQKKKTMKTPAKNSNAKAQNRPEQPRTRQLPGINFPRRRANRALQSRDVLTLLRHESPESFPLAEVIGTWVWLQFNEKQPSTITRILSELGFHWNRTRQTWQHPCGDFRHFRRSFRPATTTRNA